VRAAFSVLQRHLTVFRRTWWSNVMFNFIEPFLYLAAMGFGLGSFVQEMDGMSYIQYIAPGMVASSGMWAATFECTYGSFIRLHMQKTFHAMLVTPTTVADIVAGEVMFALVKSVLFGMVILIIITLLGQVQSYWALLIPAFLVLPGVVFAFLAMAYTGMITRIDYLNYYITLFITPLYLFSGVFFPVSSMPVWAQLLAWANPLYHSVQVCRALAIGNVSSALWGHIISLLCLAILLAFLPVRFLKKRLIH
jgi:lipooligosaccharide transport system permease protein